MSEYQSVVIGQMFLLLDLGLTYCELALHAGKEDSRARNTMNAMNAQAMAVDLSGKTMLSHREKESFSEQLERIDSKLEQLRLLRVMTPGP